MIDFRCKAWNSVTVASLDLCDCPAKNIVKHMTYNYVIKIQQNVQTPLSLSLVHTVPDFSPGVATVWTPGSTGTTL